MTQAHARTLAIKRTPTIAGDGHLLPESEWLQRVEEVTSSILKGEQIKQLSTKFDAPQFAREFIAIAQRSGAHRDLQIRVWRQLKDEMGKPVFVGRNKRPRMEWSTYTS